MPRPEPYQNQEERRALARQLQEEFQQRTLVEELQRHFAEIDSAVLRLGLPATAFSRVDPERAEEVAEAARRALVNGQPTFWWDSLRNPASSHHYPDGNGYRHVTEYVPQGQTRCWFIVEVGEKQYPVYAVDIQHIPEVLGECFGFEYYLVGLDFDWIVGESHHNVIFVSPPFQGVPTSG